MQPSLYMDQILSGSRVNKGKVLYLYSFSLIFHTEEPNIGLNAGIGTLESS